MSVDDDRFRQPGSGYENDEAIAIAVVAAEALIDWARPSHVPDSTLWLPETLYADLSGGTRLISVNVYEQTRLGPDECALLCAELAAVEATTASHDVRTAAALVRKRAQCVVTAGPDSALLVEGP